MLNTSPLAAAAGKRDVRERLRKEEEEHKEEEEKTRLRDVAAEVILRRWNVRDPFLFRSRRRLEFYAEKHSRKVQSRGVVFNNEGLSDACVRTPLSLACVRKERETTS